MARLDGFVEDVLQLLEPLGIVRARAMFGGWGLFQDGLMFGLIIGGRLYLKTDDTTRPEFEAAGGEPFVYESRGRAPVRMSYWTPPADAEDDARALLPWARRATAAALRAARPKPKRLSSRPTPTRRK